MKLKDVPLKCVKILILLFIKFNSKPETFTIVELSEDGNYNIISSFDSTDYDTNPIFTPDKSGKKIYSISAGYKEGTAIYYFAFEVN